MNNVVRLVHSSEPIIYNGRIFDSEKEKGAYLLGMGDVYLNCPAASHHIERYFEKIDNVVVIENTYSLPPEEKAKFVSKIIIFTIIGLSLAILITSMIT